MLNNLPGVTSVHGRFYDLSSKYYRIIGNHASYYKDALRYLGCVDIKDLPGEQKGRLRNSLSSFVLIAESWIVVFCFFCRDGEAGESIHTGTGWTLRRRSLQLRRAGGIFHFHCRVFHHMLFFFNERWSASHLKLSVLMSMSAVCCCSWCIRCSSRWGTQTNSGSLTHYTPSMEAMWRNSRASSLPGANRWFTFI